MLPMADDLLDVEPDRAGATPPARRIALSDAVTLEHYDEMMHETLRAVCPIVQLTRMSIRL